MEDEFVNLAMKWGSLMEDCAAATYLNYWPNSEFHTTGIWQHKSCKWLGISPDGLVNDDIVVEIKCPFMNGNQFPYRAIPAQYVCQAQFEMFVTERIKMHFIVWTPRTTKVYEMVFNDPFVNACLGELEAFHESLSMDQLPETSVMANELLNEAKEISRSCTLIGSFRSCRTHDIFSKPDFTYFTKEINIKKKQSSQKYKASDSNFNENPNTLEMSDKSDNLRQHRNKKEYQSSVWGSNGVRNSCFIDSFLEILFHIWQRKNSVFSPDILQKSLSERKNGHFHTSKMTMWNYLSENNVDRYNRFVIGEIAAVTGIIDVLFRNISENNKVNFYLRNEARTKCLANDLHNRQRLSYYSLIYLYRKYINFDLIEDTNSFDLCSLVEFTLNDNCIENSKCHSCGRQQSITLKVTNSPIYFCVEIQQDPSSKILPMLKRMSITVNKDQYDLAGIIYHSNDHFWTQHFVNTIGIQPGFYLYNDLKYKGKAKFLGKSVKNLTPDKVRILFFEKANYNKEDGTAASLSEVQIIKTIMEKASDRCIITSTKPVKDNIAAVLAYAGVRCSGIMKKDLVTSLMENRKAVEIALSCEIDQSAQTRNMVKPMEWKYNFADDHSYSLPIQMEKKSYESKHEIIKKQDPSFIYL